MFLDIAVYLFKITIQIGNEKGVRISTDFYEEAGALNFKQVGQNTGKYEAEFVLSKEKNLELSKGYFTFCIDEIIEEANNKIPSFYIACNFNRFCIGILTCATRKNF